jgi:hypothetical protein
MPPSSVSSAWYNNSCSCFLMYGFLFIDLS